MSDFNSIGEMMQSCAAEAVAAAREQYGFTLDYSEESLQALETILANVSARIDPAASNALEQTVKMWGAYFGETVRLAFGGDWDTVQYPGKVAAVPALIVGGSNLFPLMKVFRRLTMGEAENVWKFYGTIRQKLSTVHPSEGSSA